MIRFKKIYFNYSEKAAIQAAFIKSAIKRDDLTQLQLSTSNIGTDKLFFGCENKKGLYFMRIKNSLELILPNIIFRLPKNETSFYYEFHLSMLATITFFLLIVVLILTLLQAIIGNTSFESFIEILLFFLIFLGLIWVELRITLFKIKKAIIKHQDALV